MKNTYFHGRRRKIGVFTLILACLLMGVWVRGLYVLDYLELPVGKYTSVVMVTDPQFFTLFIEHDPEDNLPRSPAKWLTQPTAKFSAEDLAGMNYESLRSMIKYRNHPPVVPKGPNQPIRVPKLSPDYWLLGVPITYLLAIPPTLLAAYLLLSKRQQPQPQPQPGPVNVAGTFQVPSASSVENNARIETKDKHQRTPSDTVSD